MSGRRSNQSTTTTPAEASDSFDWTLLHHLESRAAYFYIYAVRSIDDYGWDIVLRIDGTYSDKRTALEVAKALRDHLVPPPKAIWWDGPPDPER